MSQDQPLSPEPVSPEPSETTPESPLDDSLNEVASSLNEVASSIEADLTAADLTAAGSIVAGSIATDLAETRVKSAQTEADVESAQVEASIESAQTEAKPPSLEAVNARSVPRRRPSPANDEILPQTLVRLFGEAVVAAQPPLKKQSIKALRGTIHLLEKAVEQLESERQRQKKLLRTLCPRPHKQALADWHRLFRLMGWERSSAR
jgi:hypothetical protein